MPGASAVSYHILASHGLKGNAKVAHCQSCTWHGMTWTTQMCIRKPADVMTSNDGLHDIWHIAYLTPAEYAWQHAGYVAMTHRGAYLGFDVVRQIFHHDGRIV